MGGKAIDDILCVTRTWMNVLFQCLSGLGFSLEWQVGQGIRTATTYCFRAYSGRLWKRNAAASTVFEIRQLVGLHYWTWTKYLHHIHGMVNSCCVKPVHCWLILSPILLSGWSDSLIIFPIYFDLVHKYKSPKVSLFASLYFIWLIVHQFSYMQRSTWPAV